MNEPVRPLAYATPIPPAASRRCWHEFIGWRTLIGGYVIVGALFIPTLLLIPRMERIWQDFNTELPSLTVALLDFSRWVSISHGWLYLLVLPAVLSVLVGGIAQATLRRRPQQDRDNRRRTAGWGAAVLLTGLALMMIAAITIFAMYLPMFSLIDSLSGN